MICDIHDANYKRRQALMIKNRYIVDKAIKEYIEWKTVEELAPFIKKIKSNGDDVYKERLETFKHKKETKDNEKLAELLLKSTSNAYVNRAIEVLKEEHLKGRSKECRGHNKQDLSDLNYTMISLISNKINILIVGGGEAAFIKCRSFSKEGCNVTVVSKEFCPEFLEVKDLYNVKLIKDDYNEAYVDNNHIVIIATNSKETNEIIKKYCDSICKLYVHCEDYKRGLFVTPVQKDTNNMKFALHTKNSSPKTALFMAKIMEDKLCRVHRFYRLYL